MAMAELPQGIDLTCDEAIIEDLIEPSPSQRSYSEELQEASSFGAAPSKRICQIQIALASSESPAGSLARRKECSGAVPRRRRKRVRRFPLSASNEVERKRSPQPRLGEDETEDVGTECDDPIHTVLPIEIRWRVFGEFPPSDRLALRLVSRQWKSTMDSINKLHVKINGDSDNFKGKCGLPMKTCTLANFQNPAHRQFFKAAPVPEGVRVMRGICYLNFEELVLQWSYLTRLELCWRSIMRNLLFAQSTMECSTVLKKPEIFPNLACLRIELLIHDSLGQITKLRILSNLTNLTNYSYPRLVHVAVVFVGYRELHAENRYIPVLVPFLNRHANSLDTITFTMKYASHIAYPPAHPRHILFCVPANFKCSSKKYYSAVETHLVTTELKKLGPEDHQDWMTILSDTRKLEIAIMSRFLSWSIRHLDYFAPTIMQYAKFLRVIELMNLTMYNSGAHNTVTELDAKVFSPCTQLAELRVFRAPIIFHEDEVEPPTELNNLQELPMSLEVITVDGLPAAATDILQAIKKLENLKMFHYFQSQVPRRNLLVTNGINWEVLQGILKHRTLQSANVHITSQGNSPIFYEEELKQLSKEYGWNTNGIESGYMNLFQITLSK